MTTATTTTEIKFTSRSGQFLNKSGTVKFEKVGQMTGKGTYKSNRLICNVSILTPLYDYVSEPKLSIKWTMYYVMFGQRDWNKRETYIAVTDGFIDEAFGSDIRQQLEQELIDSLRNQLTDGLTAITKAGK